MAPEPPAEIPPVGTAVPERQAPERTRSLRTKPHVPAPPSSENGVVVTPFAPPRPARQMMRRAPSVTVDLLPGARVEVVDLSVAPGVRRPVVRPDPNRLIQTEAAEDASPAARLLAFTRLVLGVASFGVILGVGIVVSFRLIVAFFRAAF